MNIGILALQGAFIEHAQMLDKIGVDYHYIKKVSDINNMISGLIIPGGESTTINKLMEKSGLDIKLKELIEKGVPVLATCAGMILISRTIDGKSNKPLGILDIEVCRNGFGRQSSSFELKSDIKHIGTDISMVFVRAPYVRSCSKDIEILSSIKGELVAVKYKNIIALSFHPELTDDVRIHEYFKNLIQENDYTFN